MEALVQLAIMYRDGEAPVEINIIMAKKLFWEAAKKRDVQGMGG